MLIKSVSKTIKNEAKEQKGGCFSMLLGTLSVSLLGNLLKGEHSVRAGEDTMRADRVFGATSSFNKFRNTKVLSKRT